MEEVVYVINGRLEQCLFSCECALSGIEWWITWVEWRIADGVNSTLERRCACSFSCCWSYPSLILDVIVGIYLKYSFLICTC